MTRSRTVPTTSNQDAAALITGAKNRCEGCRLSWRLRGWKHGEPMPITCQAQTQRQQLRDIAASFVTAKEARRT